MEDTIAAISTALGVGAISIVRVSGVDAIEIVNKIFDQDLLSAETHTIHYGHIIDNNEIIDEVLVSIMKAPRTFTYEDVVEINTHGGIATTNKVLELLLLNGARLAEPGEFTKRAFLNGRIDLVEAEGIMNLIEAKSDISRKLALKQVNGVVSNNIRELREKIMKLIANIAVNIDYPEYEDILEVTTKDVEKEITYIESKLNEILKQSNETSLVLEGLKTVILGRPNVGKSSILNMLLNEEKAIVTDIAGTTRDVVEGTLNLNGVYLKLLDTAGVHEASDKVEEIGINKSLSLIKDAELILLVLDNSSKLTAEDKRLLELTKDKNRIIIINKVDLNKELDLNEENTIYLSAINKTGLEELKKKIVEMFNLDSINTDMNMFVNADDIAKIKRCLNIIDKIKKNINSIEIDMIDIDLREINDILGSTIGESYDEEILDTVFKNFCLGK